VEALESRYDKLLSNVTRLNREINNLNKRASARPTPAGTVAEGERQVTSTMAAYGSTLEHTVRTQLVWFRKQVEKAEQAALACRQLLRGQSGGDAPMASRVNSEEFDSSTDRQGASKRTKKKKKTPQFYAVAAGREIGGCSVGIFKTWRECNERVNGFSGCSFKGFALEEEAEAWLSDELDYIADRAMSDRVSRTNRREEAQALERQEQQRQAAARAEERSTETAAAGREQTEAVVRLPEPAGTTATATRPVAMTGVQITGNHLRHRLGLSLPPLADPRGGCDAAAVAQVATLGELLPAPPTLLRSYTAERATSSTHCGWRRRS
jgi:hypothetical protein